MKIWLHYKKVFLFCQPILAKKIEFSSQETTKLDIFITFYFLFTPIIPPNMPKNIPMAIITIDCKSNINFQFNKLEMRYIMIK